jgi:hypothetical protein
MRFFGRYGTVLDYCAVAVHALATCCRCWAAIARASMAQSWHTDRQVGFVVGGQHTVNLTFIEKPAPHGCHGFHMKQKDSPAKELCYSVCFQALSSCICLLETHYETESILLPPAGICCEFLSEPVDQCVVFAGAGKTHQMGTSAGLKDISSSAKAIIPRACSQILGYIQAAARQYEITLKVGDDVELPGIMQHRYCLVLGGLTGPVISCIHVGFRVLIVCRSCSFADVSLVMSFFTTHQDCRHY